MKETTIKQYLNLNDKESKQLQKLTKKELIGIITGVTLRGQNQDEYIAKLEAGKEILQTKLDKAESYVEQGRAMISSVMERWYEYDV